MSRLPSPADLALNALTRYPLIATGSLDEARRVYSATSTPVRVEPIASKSPFHWQCNLAKVGPLSISVHHFRSGVIGISDGALDCYAMSFVTAGRAEHSDGKRLYSLLPHRIGMIYSPSMAPTVKIDTEHQGTQVMIERAVMDAAFTALTGVPPREPIRFESKLDASSGIGASTDRFLGFLVSELDQDSAALRSSMVTRRLVEGFLYNLLLEQPHSCSEQLSSAPPAAGPSYVRQLEEYLKAHADSPVSLADMAALTGVSIRSIQAAFRTSRGYTPMEFLRARRFELARQRLLTGRESRDTTVTQVALGCGFEHLGRFSIEYRLRFGESPRDTLRRSAVSGAGGAAGSGGSGEATAPAAALKTQRRGRGLPTG